MTTHLGRTSGFVGVLLACTLVLGAQVRQPRGQVESTITLGVTTRPSAVT